MGMLDEEVVQVQRTGRSVSVAISMSIVARRCPEDVLDLDLHAACEDADLDIPKVKHDPHTKMSIGCLSPLCLLLEIVLRCRSFKTSHILIWFSTFWFYLTFFICIFSCLLKYSTVL